MDWNNPIDVRMYYRNYGKKNNHKRLLACKKYREKNRQKLRAKSKEYRIKIILKSI